jgi:hypothetical protein
MIVHTQPKIHINVEVKEREIGNRWCIMEKSQKLFVEGRKSFQHNREGSK